MIMIIEYLWNITGFTIYIMYIIIIYIYRYIYIYLRKQKHNRRFPAGRKTASIFNFSASVPTTEANEFQNLWFRQFLPLNPREYCQYMIRIIGLIWIKSLSVAIIGGNIGGIPLYPIFKQAHLRCSETSEEQKQHPEEKNSIVPFLYWLFGGYTDFQTEPYGKPPSLAIWVWNGSTTRCKSPNSSPSQVDQRFWHNLFDHCPLWENIMTHSPRDIISRGRCVFFSQVWINSPKSSAKMVRLTYIRMG